MADRELRVHILGDSSSLQGSFVKAEVGAGKFESAMQHASGQMGVLGKNTDEFGQKIGGLHSLLGSGIGTAVAATTVTAGIGLAIEAGKSAVEIAEKQDRAERSLAQALASRSDVVKQMPGDLHAAERATTALHNATRLLAEFDVSHKGHKLAAIDLMHRQDLLAKVKTAQETLNATTAQAGPIDEAAFGSQEKFRKSLEDFIDTNGRYIKTQSDVTEGAAILIRSGLNSAEVQKDLGRALDLSTLKHIDYLEAVKLVDAAEHGRLKGLIDLGIVKKDQTDADGNLIAGAKNTAIVMGEVDAKVKDGRKSQTELEQASNQLGNRWQHISRDIGPPLVKGMSDIVNEADQVYMGMERFGKDDSWWKGFNDGILAIINGGNLKQLVQIVEALGRAVDYLGTAGNNAHSAPGAAMGQRGQNVAQAAGATYNINVSGPDPAATSALVAAHIARGLS